MASGWYSAGMAYADLNGLYGDFLMATLCDADYTPNYATDADMDDVPSGAQLSTVSVTGRAQVGKALDFDDIVFPAVAGGDTGTQIVFWINLSPGSVLLACAQSDKVAGLPINTSGADITFVVNAGVSRFSEPFYDADNDQQ